MADFLNVCAYLGDRTMSFMGDSDDNAMQCNAMQNKTLLFLFIPYPDRRF